MTIENMLASKDYKAVLKNFCELSAVPRGSGYNRKISDWLCAFAAAHGLKYTQDEALNVLIQKPATKGMEQAPAVMLQGHMDMVCVQTEGNNHDFEQEGLVLETDGTYLSARHTTLGADDGISIAYMLSLLTDESIKHPKLLCLITTDEETGMDGAKAVEASLLQAKYLINLDSEEEGVIWCGCAGGKRMELRLPLILEQTNGTPVTINIRGLSGGHSGAEIHKYIPNANKVLGRLLYELSGKLQFRLVSFCGGEKDNSIPVAASTKIVVTEQRSKEEIKAVLDALAVRMYAVYGRGQKQMNISTSVEEEQTPAAMSAETTKKALFLFLQVPDGVQRMSTEIEGLVETSINLGIMETTKEYLHYHFSLRSSVAEELSFLSKRLKGFAEIVNGSCQAGSEYPAWEYQESSYLRELFGRCYLQVTGKEAKNAVIHAGLECGLFGEKMPQADMISVGPNMHDIHTPKERLEIGSAIRMYQVLEQVLEQFGNGERNEEK